MQLLHIHVSPMSSTRPIVQGDSPNDPENTVLIEDVRDAVGDLVEIIKTYKSKGRLSQVLMSTLFKRRQEEVEAVIEAAISRLHVSEKNSFGTVSNTLRQLFVRPVEWSTPDFAGNVIRRQRV